MKRLARLARPHPDTGRLPRPLASLVAVLLVVGVLGVLFVAAMWIRPFSIHHAAPPDHRAVNVPKGPVPVTTPTSTHVVSPQAVSPQAVSPGAAACRSLLVALDTLNWHSPTLSEPLLAQWATPALAEQLAAAPHMTPGEILNHFDVTAQVQIEAVTGTHVVAQVTQSLPAGTVESTWICSLRGGQVSELGPSA